MIIAVCACGGRLAVILAMFLDQLKVGTLMILYLREQQCQQVCC